MLSRVDYVKKNMFGKSLDIGCNSGTFHELMDDRKLIGLDIIIEKPNKRKIQGSALKMPFKKKEFDTLIAGEVIEHFDEKQAKKLGVSFAIRDVFLDNDADENYISSQFDILVQAALDNGHAIGIAHDKDLSIRVLKKKISLDCMD